MSLQNNPLLQQLKQQLKSTQPKTNTTAHKKTQSKQSSAKQQNKSAAPKKAFTPAVVYNPNVSLFTYYKQVLELNNLACLNPEFSDEETLPFLDPAGFTRQDLTDENFFTLDSASSQDLDDALCIAATPTGWQLKIALADPAAYLAKGSVQDIEAKNRASSFYLPGQVIHLLPTEVSSCLASLLAGQRRPALVISLEINTQGELVGKADFSLAWVQSKAKLDYKNVAAWLDKQGNWQPNQQLATSLMDLVDFAKARHKFRLQNQLVNTNQQDFRFYVNDLGQLQDFKVEEKNLAHELIEEAMLLANQQAAKFLAEEVKAGVFTSYPGFKPKYLSQVEELLNEAGITGLGADDLISLEGYLALQSKLKAADNPWLALRLKRLQENLSLSLVPKLHLGLGVCCYASITAPLRRYVDLINLRLIKAYLTNQPLQIPSSLEIDQLNTIRLKQRRAENLIRNQLYALYLANKLGEEFTARVYGVNKGGLRVNLVENGASAFVPASFLRQQGKDFTLLPEEGILEINNQPAYKLGQEFKVRLEEVKQEQASLIVKPC